MTEYFVTFFTKVSAKNDKQLEKQAEIIAEKLSKCLKKRVESHGYVEIEKKDTPIVIDKQEVLM